MPAEEFGRPETDAQHSPGPLGIFDKDTQRKRRSGKASGPLADNRGFLDWMFRSRKNGRITLVQLPNWLLGVWLLTSVAMWQGQPKGPVGASLFALAWAALAWWAGDEVLRGVNPFRRFLGAAVLAWLLGRSPHRLNGPRLAASININRTPILHGHDRNEDDEDFHRLL